jgi:hypothetical protein
MAAPDDQPEDTGQQGVDEDVVVSADAGTVSGLGPRAALDEVDEVDEGAEEDAD